MTILLLSLVDPKYAWVLRPVQEVRAIAIQEGGCFHTQYSVCLCVSACVFVALICVCVCMCVCAPATK